MAESCIDDDTLIHDEGRIYGTKVVRADENCVNWDTDHGLLAWSITTFVTAALLAGTIGSIDRTAYLNFDFPCRIVTGLIHR